MSDTVLAGPAQGGSHAGALTATPVKAPGGAGRCRAGQCGAAPKILYRFLRRSAGGLKGSLGMNPKPAPAPAA